MSPYLGIRSLGQETETVTDSDTDLKAERLKVTSFSAIVSAPNTVDQRHDGVGRESKSSENSVALGHH